MSLPTLLTEWARLFIGSLRRAGLQQVVLSPGSRSTPFAWAVLREPGLACRTVIDERSAAFFALGHARVTGQPAMLLCTSGTAAANYFPALVEAAESNLPVLVMTTDRPLEHQRAAAPQTIDQVKLYGGYARAYFELGSPDPDLRMLRALPRLATQAMLEARSPVPGPVHINARARKPLEPRAADTAAELELHAVVDRLLESVPRSVTPALQAPDAADLEDVVGSCRRASRGLILCGPCPAPFAAAPESIRELASATGFPVAAEAASQFRFADPGDAVRLDSVTELLEVPGFVERWPPDVIIQLGRPPTATGWHAALQAWRDTEHHVLTPFGWPDPWGTARTLVRGPLDATVRVLASTLAGDPVGAVPGDRTRWREALRSIDARARALTDAAVASGFSEGAAIRTVVDRLPAGGVLALGNSLPIREVDTFVPGRSKRLTVCFQRGANGIDGPVSGAAGAAAASAVPTTLLVGDVSLAHDIGGLAQVRDLPTPLTVVVLNNGGGRIFERLPITETLESEEDFDPWLTPPGVDFSAAAAAFGIPFRRARDPASLTAALAALESTGGVLEVVVPDGGTTEHQDALRRRLEAELAG